MLLASIPLGLAITAFLWINELPDARADASAGKRTLVVVLGHARAAKAFAALLAITWLGVVVLPFLGLPLGIWGALIGAPLALRAARRVLRFPDVAERLVPAQQATLLSFVLLAVGAALGVLLVG